MQKTFEKEIQAFTKETGIVPTPKSLEMMKIIYEGIKEKKFTIDGVIATLDLAIQEKRCCHETV